MKPINLLLLLLLFSGQVQAGSTEMIQKLLPTGKESNISLTEDVCPENATVFWRDPLNEVMGIYYPDGKTNVFEGKVNITGPRTLTFLSPQTSDSGVYFARVIGDQHKNITIHFNITFQDQNTATTVAPTTVAPTTVAPTRVAPSAFSPTTIAALAIIAAAAFAICLFVHLKKKCQDQKEAFSANSGTNSPNPPQENGVLHLSESNHLMEGITGDSAV